LCWGDSNAGFSRGLPGAPRGDRAASRVFREVRRETPAERLGGPQRRVPPGPGTERPPRFRKVVKRKLQAQGEFSQLVEIIDRFLRKNVRPLPPADILDVALSPSYGWVAQLDGHVGVAARVAGSPSAGAEEEGVRDSRLGVQHLAQRVELGQPSRPRAAPHS
jgi:hypothetical protein